jgi:predicted AlkP superfamily phosphohydrolase/phosphomutase
MIDRREFIKRSLLGAGAVTASSLFPARIAFPAILSGRRSGKVFVLGIDGMDPNLLRLFVQRGEMPAFKRLMDTGYFGPLQTTMPPQSPVAWSSFISGCRPGGHGIYDFIHRDPDTFTPYSSVSRSYDTSRSIRLGKWSIPLKGGEVKLLRGGQPFWSVLEANDIPTTLFKLPANFPVQESDSEALSGMGTPDLLGTYGTFTYYSESEVPGAEGFTGGRVVRIKAEDHTVSCILEGPPNSLRNDGEPTRAKFLVRRDPMENVVKIDIQGREILLKQGEWSEWIPVGFDLILMKRLYGMVRFYVQQVHPGLKLYVSPINVDPSNPSLPISSPKRYAETLSGSLGRFYTQGFPEDTKALSNGIFSDEEFLAQSNIVLEERLHAFDHQLKRFNEGVFFFYFSTIDQNSHMMLRTMVPSHPMYDPKASSEVKNAMYGFYRKMDDVLQMTIGRMDSRSTLILLSDHGFAPFRREFNLSTWLVQNGFTAVTDAEKYHDDEFYDHVDWSRTKAYAMGLNSLYLNVRGREFRGSVMSRDIQAIKADLIDKLNKVRDPMTGERVILQAYDGRKLYRGPYGRNAPDIVIGYANGYRISDESGLGKFPKETIGNRTDKWSSDHCMDPSVVPGVLLTNREVTADRPGIWDLAPSILDLFGISKPFQMEGESIYG